MDFSVIVCSKNRAESLRRCLRAIFDIRYTGRWEVIVVDNASTDDTPRVVAQMAALAPVAFRSYVEPRPGNSVGRNTGAEQAAGELLFFTDDDCLVDPDILSEMRKVFADPRMGYAGGRIRLQRAEDYPTAIMDVPHTIRIPPRSIVYPGLVQGSNMAFRREALLQLGGFDPQFGAGTAFAGEEIELATRASMGGWLGGYFPGPLVRHDHGRNKAQAMRSERQYDLGVGACYGKFLLDASMRRQCLLVWCRRSVKQLFKRPVGLPRQIAGAFRYARMQRQLTGVGG